MQSKFRALKFALLASLAASGMAAAQTSPPTTDQAGTAPTTDPNNPQIEAPVAGGPSASTKKSATEEIVVTGTRVRRKDLNTPAPVTVVSRDQITASGRVSVGDFLQTLPEQGNTVNTQVNNGNDGSVRVALRSLGSARTLVLVNGRRMVPGGTGADPAADLNTIPTAAIERLEILKDGASAIYGSDAIAGVVNVILRKRYTGTEVGGFAGISQKGDGETYDVHGLTGTAGDKASVLFAVGYQEQRPAVSTDRQWASATYAYDWETGEKTASGNSSTFPNGRFNLPGRPKGVGLPANCAPGFSAPTVGFDPTQNQKACDAFAANPKASSLVPNGPNDWVAYDNSLYNTNTGNYFITPSRRIQLFSTGDVNLGSEARAFFEAVYVNRTSDGTRLQPMPVVNNTIPTAPVTVSKDSLFNPFGVDITSWRRRTMEFGDRIFSQNLDTFRVVVGTDGALGDWAGPLTGWTWGLDYNHGRTAGTNRQTGQISMSRLANAVGPSMRDANGNAICTREPGKPETKIGGCVPTDVLHGLNTLSPEARNYVAFDGTDFGHNQQDIWSINFSGDVVRLGADRPIGLAIGGDYRRESASFLPNPITASLDSSGNNQLPTSGGYKVWEGYGELVVPLLSRMPLVEDLEVQGAFRFNNFSTFGSETTYKFGLRYSPIRDLTVRGTYGTAYRAPNVGELYGGAADNFPGARDPCNADATQRTKDRCVLKGVQNGGDAQDPSTQLLTKNFANPNLGPETAKILTAGVVIQPQMLRNFSFTVDYYNISVEDTINTRSANFILKNCYTADVQRQDLCDLVVRGSDGRIVQINDERANVGAFHTVGWDFAARYDMGTEGYGRFNFIVDGTWLRSFRVTDELGVITDCYDRYDCATQTVGGVLPQLKMNAGVFWSLGPLGAGVQARYVGSYTECESGLCSDDDSVRRRVSSYLPFDVFASYTLRNWTAGTTQLVFGVNNVANTNPPYISDVNAFAVNSDPSTYDFVGRFFYTRLTHTF